MDFPSGVCFPGGGLDLPFSLSFDLYLSLSFSFVFSLSLSLFLEKKAIRCDAERLDLSESSSFASIPFFAPVISFFPECSLSAYFVSLTSVNRVCKGQKMEIPVFEWIRSMGRR